MAAGLGFKDFTTGEVLTSADVDGYLMQGVWVFASAAGRDAAVTSPQEGNFAYLKDTNVTTYYTGSAWANLDTTGMTNPMTTTGDTIYSSSGSTPARLGIGSTGNVLTVSGGVPVWSAPASGGGMTLLSTTSLTGASTTISSISGSYNKLELYLDDFYNDTAGYIVDIFFNSDTTAANYFVGSTRARSAGQDVAYNDDSRFTGYGTPTTQQNTFAFISMPNYSSSSQRKQYFAQTTGVSDSGTASVIALGSWKNDSVITSITLAPKGGNFGAGTAYLYGVK
jgi:hypothetical protein